MSKSVELALTPFQRSLGLRFRPEKEFTKPLVFTLSRETRFNATLDMFFVFYPIDVAFLDSSKKIVEVLEGFKPFTFHTPSKPVKHFIELPNGWVKRFSIKPGQRLSW